MESSAQFKHVIRFAEFELDLRTGELRTNGNHVIVPEKPFQILAALLERPGEMVTRDELVKRLWPAGTFVDFNLGLNKAVNRLRELLHDSAEQPRFIETFPKRGYRFTGAIVGNGPAAAGGIPADVISTPDTSGGPHASDLLTGGPQLAASRSVRASNKGSRWKPAALAAIALTIALAAGYAIHTHQTRTQNPDIEKIQITKLTDSGRADLVAISSDGRYVCYSLRESGGLGLWLRQVATVSDTQILPSDAIAFEGITFSPDGDHIYYVRADKNDPGFKYLYVMPALGGPSKLLVKDIDSPVSFSPNGSQFVYTRGLPAQNATEIRIANADGSRNQLLVTVPNTFAGFQPGATWSPDGRTIAVSLLHFGEKYFTLYDVSVSDSSLRELHSSPNAIGRPLWLPEGDVLLLVMADQNGSGQLWTISYPKAEIRRVTNDLTNYDTRAELSRDAKTMVAMANQILTNIWAAPAGHIDKAVQITSIALPLIQVNESPEGRLLAIGQDGRLWSLASDGSQRVPFTDVVNVGVLAPCGRYVVLTSNQATTTELLRVDNDGQNPTTLASGQLASWSVACSQDGQYVFYVDLHRPHTIFRVPVAGGKPMKIGEVLGELMVGRLSISPDQSFLAYPYEEYTPAPVLKLAIIPANGGPPLKIITAPGGAQLARLSPDGKSLQYVLTENGASNLWEQSLLGGKRRQLTNFPNGQIFDFHWSLDGKRLLLSRGEVNSDVVLLSNLR